jgi:hypothetical protein
MFGHMMRRRRAAALSSAVLTITVVMLTACSSSGNNGGSKSTSSGAASTGSADAYTAQAQQMIESALKLSTSIPQTTPLGAPVPSSGSYVFLQNVLPATTLIGDEIKKGTKAIGWDYSTVTYTAGDPGSIQKALLTALAKKPTVVACTGCTVAQVGASLVSDYKQANIPILLGGSCNPDQVAFPLVSVSTCASEDKVGKLLANSIILDSQGKAKILHMFMPYASGYVRMEAALKKTLDDHCPGCSYKTVQLTFAQLTSGATVRETVNALRANPGYKYVVFDIAAAASGFKSSLSSVGLNDIKWYGRSADTEQIQLMQAGSKSATWTAISYPLMGTALVDAALRVVTKTAGAENDGNLPIQLVTSANAKTIPTPYNAPADALPKFQKLWKVG